MLSVDGFCSICRKELSWIEPGLKCRKCGKCLHGNCLIPPLDTDAMDHYLQKHKAWCCSSCKKSINTERADSRLKQIKNHLEMVGEFREIINLIEDTLATISDECDKLTMSAVLTTKENMQLRQRIQLHEHHGRKVPKNFDDWRIMRKNLGVTEDSSKTKKYDSSKIDDGSEKVFKKVAKLTSHLQKNYSWQKKPKPTKKYSNEPKENSFNKTIKAAKEKFSSWTRENFSSLTEGWLIQLYIFIVLIVYTFIGALIFWVVEGRYEQQLVKDILEARYDVNTSMVNKPSKKAKKYLLNEYYDYLAEKFTQNTNLLIRGDRINWSFAGAMYFCGITYTTIGYGDMAPVTDAGKILTILYSLFGIPLFLIFLTLFGRNFSNVIRLFSTCCKKRSSLIIDNDDLSNVPLWPVLIVGLIYLILGAVLFMYSEGYTYLESFYFVVITMLTIGFGDNVLSDKAIMIIFVTYIIVGLVITTTIISITVDKLIHKLNIAKEKLGMAADTMPTTKKR